MNTRVLVMLSLLVGIGFVLHYVIPPVLFGMKPDMSLAMMFLGITLFPQVRYVLLLSLLTGFVSALTTGFPMGQIINIIEKPITAFIFLALFLLAKNLSKHLITVAGLTIVGTIVSGSIFLALGLYIVNVQIGAGFIALFLANVLPATILNTIVIVILYPIVQELVRRNQLALSS